MYYSEITEATQQLASLKLQASISNYNSEIELLEYLTGVVEAYTGQWNKRLETYLNVKLADKYGTCDIQDDYGAKEVKTYSNVYAVFSKESYSDSYKLDIGYHGLEASRDYDSKVYKLVKRHFWLEIWSIKDKAGLLERMAGISTAHVESISKFKLNKSKLSQLVKQHNTLAKQVAEYNDAISYAISDELRIK